MSNYQEVLSSRDLRAELKAFSEGRSTHAWRCFGSHPAKANDGTEGYLFRVWAPKAAKVTILGDFNNWVAQATPMTKKRKGIWEAFVPGLQRYDNYQYAVHTKDGRFCPKADPYSFHAATRPDTASKIYDLAGGHQWGDKSWLAYRAKQNPYTSPMNIYECHLGSWRRTGTGEFLGYRDAASYLVPYAKEMGFTHVEFLPITEHPLDASWGYQCTGYFAATSRFGPPDDFKYLIDQLHQAGIGVILDWVPSHFPRDRFGLYHFDGTPTYEHPDPLRGENTIWGTNSFDLRRNEVRSFLLSSAMFWLEEYHADGLRVDAVSSMLYLDYGHKEGEWLPNEDGSRENPHAIAFFRQLNAAVQSAHPDVLMIAEDSSTFPKVTQPIAEGGLGFQFKWNLGWTHDISHYITLEPALRPDNHRDITFSLMYAFTEHYILPLSHDDAVHGTGSLLSRMPGDTAQKFAGVRAFYTYMMTHPGKKLTFMGVELGQWNEWRHEYSLDWHLLQYEPHRQNQAFFRAMNALYLEQPALWELDSSWDGFQWLRADDSGASTISYLRWDKQGKPLIVVCNFSLTHHQNHRVGAPIGGTWASVLNTDDIMFGGQGLADPAPRKTEKVPCDGQAQSLVLDLPPMTAVVYRCIRKNPVRKGGSEPVRPTKKAVEKRSAPKKKAPVQETAGE